MFKLTVILGGVGALLAAAACVCLLASGPGTRLGWWDFRRGMALFVSAGFLGLGGVVFSGSGLALNLLARPTPAVRGLYLGLAAGLAAFLPPFYLGLKARRAPLLHDVSTDTQDPPLFIQALLERAKAKAPNPADWAGDPLASQLAKDYPDIRPLYLAAPPSQALELASRAATGLGWRILPYDRNSRRLEAVDTTFWFGFKDDVVVRIRPAAEGGSRVDVRSVSRQGRGDTGANAERIRRFLARVRKESDNWKGSPAAAPAGMAGSGEPQ